MMEDHMLVLRWCREQFFLYNSPLNLFHVSERIKESKETHFAPLFNNDNAAVCDVAPVVTTSSINNTFLLKQIFESA